MQAPARPAPQGLRLLRELSSAALVVLMLLWLPVGLVQVVDGFLVFLGSAQLARDIALLVVLSVGLASVLALFAWVLARLIGLLPLPAALREGLPWLVLLAPLAVLCAWQWFRMLRAWVTQVFGWTVLFPPTAKALIAGLFVAALLWLVYRSGLTRNIERLRGLLKGPARLCWALAALCAVWVALDPPALYAPAADRMPGATGGPAPGRAPGAPAVNGPRDVFIISMDAVSALDAPLCGDGPVPLPRLRELAQVSTCFARTYAASNYTTPTTATIETGLLPWTHFSNQIAAKLSTSWRDHSLAHRISGQGWRTLSVTENILASPLQRGTWSGWSDARFAGAGPIDWIREPLLRFPESSAAMLANALMSFLDSVDRFRAHTPYDPDSVYAQALQWLGRSDRPAFMWLHTMPPHAPYLPPPSTKYRLLPAGELDTWKEFMPQSSYYAPDKQPRVDKIRLRYRELLMSGDESLGRFIDALKAQGRFEQALIVFTSDHGESFERGYLGHAGTVTHEAVLRIPLMIKLPGQSAPRIVDTPVSQADVVPTVAEALQLKPPRLAEGRSLMPALRGEALPQEPVYSMSLERQSRFQPLRLGHFVVVEGNHKAVLHLATGQAELYDLERDPGERQDLAAAQPQRLAAMRARIEAKLGEAEQRRLAQQVR